MPEESRGGLRRILIVEDDERVRHALAQILPARGWEPVMAASAARAAAMMRLAPPAAVLLDLGLPDRDGVGLLQDLKAAWPAVPVVVLSAATAKARILAALRGGAQGYLFKEDLGAGVLAALDEAVAGGAPMSRPVARLVLEQLRPPAAAVARELPRPISLTDREVEIVTELAHGLTYEQVGTALGISANTVRTHIRMIYDKLAVGSRTEAVMVALRLGLVAT